MSNLRQKKRETVDPDEDIEALISPDDDGAPGPATSSKPVTAGRLQHNPFFVARLVLRKVGELITSDDDNEDNITSSVGIIAFLRDLVIGIVFGLLTVSFLIFLDHKDVIHLKSAHGYRDMGLQMMRDPETRKNVEENSGLKFMEADEYQRKLAEVNAFPAKIKPLEENTRKYLADLEVAKKEHAAIKPGYDILALDPMLGLDKFCGECKWNGGTNCDARLGYLMSTYNLQRVKATLDLMKSTRCGACCVCGLCVGGGGGGRRPPPQERGFRKGGGR
jgi:hypothetical protein